MDQGYSNHLEEQNDILLEENAELKRKIALLEKGARKELKNIKEDPDGNITTAEANLEINDTITIESDVYQSQPRTHIEKQLTSEKALVVLKSYYKPFHKCKTRNDSMVHYHVYRDSIKQEIMGTDNLLAETQYQFTCTRIAYLEVREYYKMLKAAEVDKRLSKEEQAKVRERLKEAKTKARDKKKELRKKTRVLKGNILKIEREKKRGLDEEAKTDKLVNSG